MLTINIGGYASCYHFLNITNTASTISAKPNRWFQPNFSVLKKIVVKTINTVSVTASCIVFN